MFLIYLNTYDCFYTVVGSLRAVKIHGWTFTNNKTSNKSNVNITLSTTVVVLRCLLSEIKISSYVNYTETVNILKVKDQMFMSYWARF